MERLTASQYRALRKEAEKKRKPAKKKPEVSAHTKALKKADTAYSLWFRANEADENGLVRCTTCRRRPMLWRMPDGSCQTGHYESRGIAAVRFMPTNCGIQCSQCNYYKEGAKIKMRQYLVKRYGEDGNEPLRSGKSAHYFPRQGYLGASAANATPALLSV